MSRGHLLLSLLLLALALGLVYLATGWMEPPARSPEIVGPPRSGYTLKDFRMNSYAADGRLVLRMQAPSLQRRENDHSLYIDQPRFLVPASAASQVPPWHGHSEYAWVQADGKLVRLLGKVQMHRDAFAQQPATRLDTTDLDYWPDRQKLLTSHPARLQQGTTRMFGIGMRADLATNQLELLDDVHGTFAPATRH